MAPLTPLRRQQRAARRFAAAALGCTVLLLGPAISFVAPLAAPPAGALTARRAAESPTTVVERQPRNLLEDAVAGASYDMWVAEFPGAAAAGEFLGQKVSREDTLARVNALRRGLDVEWAQVMGLVSTASLVLFAGSEERVARVFGQLVAELGSREAALETVQKQPALLLARDAELQGRGGLLQAFAEISEATRPVYKVVGEAVRATNEEAARVAVFPKLLELTRLGY